MNKILLLFCAYLLCFASYGQNNFWTQANQSNLTPGAFTSDHEPSQFKSFGLDFEGLKNQLRKAPVREGYTGQSILIVSFPTPEGNVEKFRVLKANTLHPDLIAKYPGIESYAGKGIDDPSATIRFSISDQRGFHGMIQSGHGTSYIDPHGLQASVYNVYARAHLDGHDKKFECLTHPDKDFAAQALENSVAAQATDDKKLRRYRLALSCTAEYGNIFAGSGTDAQKKANILAQMNITMTRVNGIYERDLAITMEIIPNNDDIIYYGSAGSDPWSNEWNSTTQTTIDNIIGNANYDIGHNFNTTGGGNAGCIGCVCTAGSKGSAYTGRSDPTGDPFDIDYVAHEVGHQFGGYHVMNTCSRSGSGATEVEPASGSSIMGYAGICSTNIQSNSDAYFNYVNIRDISANVQTGTSSSCPQEVNLANNPPTANAGANHTIPKSTPFVLRGQGTDPDGDQLTYTWEQNDPERASGNGSPQSTWTVGPMFRSIEGTTSPDRYMPNLSSVIAGNLSPTWEVVPSVARTMEFALTVRDNVAGGGQTADDLMTVTVNGSAGPFVVSSPNTNVTWNVGQNQTVTWDVAGTNSSPVNCANVNILLSTDGGNTYPITLVSNTPNDGSQSVTVPNNVSTNCRIMVEAADNIFYDISNSNFTIEGAVQCNPTVPTGLAASNIGSSGATLDWNAVAGATYDVRYRVTGTSTWTNTTAGGNTLNLTGLTAETQYESQVRSNCTGNTSAYSASVNFTTTQVQLNYCASNGQNTNDEYIGRVQIGSIDNTSGAGSGGYTDFTNVSTDLTADASVNITITPTWTGTVYNEGYSIWIDYNQDGDFTDAGEQVFTRSATTATPISGSFTVSSSAASGNTRMRVSMKYNGIPTACESFTYGEVEDYTVNIISAQPDTEAPTAPSSLTASNTTETSTDLSWNASTDNVGVTGYDVYQGATVIANTSSTSYQVIGLNSGTSYSFSVIAKDAAGNESVASNVVNVTTQSPDTQAPTAPTGLNASNTTETSTDLSWNASTDNVGVTGYDVFVGGSLSGSTASTSFTVSGLSAANSYSMYVVAKDAAGNVSNASNTVNVTTPDNTAPGAPTNLVSSNTTQTSTDVSWSASTDNVGVTGYDISVDGNLNGSTSSTSYSITGLSANTTYSVSVVAKDAAGNTSGSTAINVTTAPEPGSGCTGGITSFPYNQGWESGIGSWTQASNDDLNWTVDANGTPSNSTGPSSATEGSNCLYVESSGNGTGYPNKTAIITSPCYDLSAETEATFSFSYHMYGSSMGSLNLQVSDDDGASWSSLWSLSGNQGNSWQSVNIDLGAYTGGSIQLRYVGTTANSWRSDMAIDQLNISTGSTPGCTDVTLTLVVDNYPEETSWTITDDQGGTVASGGTYNSTPDGSTVIETSCLAAGCYTFTINDTYGDGICCSYGNGSYTLTDGSSTLASGGSFGSSEATNFCIGTSRNDGTVLQDPIDTRNSFVSAPAMLQLYPNPAHDQLNIYAGDLEVYSVSVMSLNGAVISQTRLDKNVLDVSQLKPGVYMISIATDKDIFVKKFIKQ